MTTIDPDAQCPIHGCARWRCDASHELTLTPAALSAAAELNAALYHWERLGERPRCTNAWAYLEARLWNARQAARKTGVLEKGTVQYDLVSGRYLDAMGRRLQGRALEADGQRNVRV